MESRRHVTTARALAVLTLLGTAMLQACGDPSGPSVEGPIVDGVRLRVLTEALEHPTAIAVVPNDDRIFIAERTGDIRVLDGGRLLDTPLLDLTPSLQLLNFEQGLLGLVLHPNFETTGVFYVNYTALGNNTHVSKFRTSVGNPNVVEPGSESLILEVEQPGPRHNGGNLVFGPDGMLYIGMGEGDRSASAQDPNDLLGAMLRIDVLGGQPYAIPPDNPFVGLPGRDEIWAIGLRNPWRYSFDPVSDQLIIGDVGEALFEEINFVPAGQAGLNYGWPNVEGFECIADDGCPEDTVEPVVVYDHSDGSCAVVGGFVYRGTALPELQGHYFFGDNCKTTLFSFPLTDPDDIRTWDFGDGIGSIFSFGTDEDNELYVLTINGAYRLEPAD